MIIPFGKVDIKERAYEYYKLDWMVKHFHCLYDFACELADIMHEDCCEYQYVPNADQLIHEFEERGFWGGDIYSCFSEFVDNEYLDEDYMEDLLPYDDFNTYIEDRKEDGTWLM